MLAPWPPRNWSACQVLCNHLQEHSHAMCTFTYNSGSHGYWWGNEIDDANEISLSHGNHQGRTPDFEIPRTQRMKTITHSDWPVAVDPASSLARPRSGPHLPRRHFYTASARSETVAPAWPPPPDINICTNRLCELKSLYSAKCDIAHNSDEFNPTDMHITTMNNLFHASMDNSSLPISGYWSRVKGQLQSTINLIRLLTWMEQFAVIWSRHRAVDGRR